MDRKRVLSGERPTGRLATCDVEVKRRLAVALNDFLEPIRQWRGRYESRPALVRDILEEGSRHARAIAQQTMTEVRDAMGIAYLARK